MSSPGAEGSRDVSRATDADGTAGERRVNELHASLTTVPDLDGIAPSLEIADIAARLRAAHRLRIPDAPPVAADVHAGAAGLITNDAAFERVETLSVLVLERLPYERSGEALRTAAAA